MSKFTKSNPAGPAPMMPGQPAGKGGQRPVTKPNMPTSEAKRPMIHGPTAAPSKGVKTTPTTPLSQKGRVMIPSTQGASGKNKGTFKAPRGGESSDPTKTGYHKV